MTDKEIKKALKTDMRLIMCDKNHKKNKKTHLVISCFNNTFSTQILPVGFNWGQILSTQYKKKYRVTILLHGGCIFYGLNNATYQASFGTLNPFATFLEKIFTENKVKIVICELCLRNDGYMDNQLLEFIKPVPFSINYIARAQLRGDLVIYDSLLPNDSKLPNNIS
jgi:intracellular sulfur oxidation DsrE/DsrF family protein